MTYCCISLGSGPCLFCGAIVCTREEQEVLNRGSRKSEILRKKLMGDDGSKGKLKYISIMDSSMTQIESLECNIFDTINFLSCRAL